MEEKKIKSERNEDESQQNKKWIESGPEATTHLWKIQEGPSGLDYYLHPFLLNTPSFEFLYRFLSETLQNFTDYAMIPVFLPKHCETLWITQQCLVLTSGILRNFTDCATMLVLTSKMLRNFTDYATMLVLRVLKRANKVRKPTASTPQRN